MKPTYYNANFYHSKLHVGIKDCGIIILAIFSLIW